MAVTNLQEMEHLGKVIYTRTVQGNGTPVGDATLAVDENFPIGSTYKDLDDGIVYTKSAAGVWTASNALQVVEVIIATNVSQTIDFGNLLIADTVIGLSDDAAEPNDGVIVVTVAGDLGQAAVVDHIYMVYRATLA